MILWCSGKSIVAAIAPPNLPYTTDATAHKSSSDKATISPLISVAITFKELKILFASFFTYIHLENRPCNMLLNISTLAF